MLAESDREVILSIAPALPAPRPVKPCGKRTMNIVAFMVSAFATFLLVYVANAEDPPAKRPVDLAIKTDRKRYDKDDTIMVIATFNGLAGTKLQLSTGGGGAVYFYLCLDAVGRKAEPVCLHLPRLQFKRPTEAEFVGGETARWLQVVGTTGTSHQFVIHLPQLPDLPEGEYKLRIGYTRRHVEELAELVEKALGKKVPIGGSLTDLVEGAWDGALLSEPITITIGPESIVPAPRPGKP